MSKKQEPIQTPADAAPEFVVDDSPLTDDAPLPGQEPAAPDAAPDETPDETGADAGAPAEAPLTSGTISLTPEQLAAVVAAEVAKAVANAGKPAAKPQPKGPAARRFVRVRVAGTYVEAINKHVSNIVNFEDEVNMPSDYNMGDLRRSLPNKLARKHDAFKRLRSVDAHSVVGPAIVDETTKKVDSDYVMPRIVPQKRAADAINKAEGFDGDDDGLEFGSGVGVDITDEERLTGLPPIVNR